MDNSKNRCDIRAEVKLRNGYFNWWCHTHHTPARGEGGTKLDKCANADLPPILDDQKIYIDLDQYQGGVGIWGSLEAIYDTKRDVPEKGVHVHLRRKVDEEKEVDKTFKEVHIKVPNQMFADEHWVKIDEYSMCVYSINLV